VLDAARSRFDRVDDPGRSDPVRTDAGSVIFAAASTTARKFARSMRANSIPVRPESKTALIASTPAAWSARTWLRASSGDLLTLFSEQQALREHCHRFP